MNEYKIHELKKCCKRYPLYHSADGYHWAECSECKNRSGRYPSFIEANKDWNKKRERQLKVENLYNGKPAWYAKEE